MAATQVIQIGKQRWLAGMDWATYPDMPSRDQLKADAQRSNSTWAALRMGEHSIQGGFCSALEGVSLGQLNGRINGLFSLAAMLADSRKQPWLGIFQIDRDLWWYIAVRDGHAIIPHGDVLGDEAAINAARNRHSGLTDWSYIEGDLADLERLINEIPAKPTPIKSMVVNWKLRKKIAAAGLLTFAAVGGGAYFWKDQADKKQAADLARIRAQALLPQAKPISRTNATNFPTPNFLLSRCAQRLDIGMSEFGWVIEKVSCSTTQATIIWLRRDGATIEHRPNGILSEDGMRVTESIGLDLEQSSEDDRVELSVARHKLLAWAQTANLELTEEAATQITPLPGSTAEVADEPQAPEKIVTITINFSPFDLELSNLPGFRIQGIESKEEGGWNLRGTLYGS